MNTDLKEHTWEDLGYKLSACLIQQQDIAVKFTLLSKTSRGWEPFPEGCIQKDGCGMVYLPGADLMLCVFDALHALHNAMLRTWSRAREMIA